MKFGGTSVGDASCIARAAQIVAQGARENAVVAVVSAMSGVTNRLVEAANRAGSGDREAGSALIVELRRQHAAALAALVSDEPRRAGVTGTLDKIFAEGQRLLDGTALLRELTPRALDAISSLGERLCAPVFTSAVAELGVKSRAIAATELIVTDTFHGGAEPRMDLTRARCEAVLRPLLNESCVPVVTGFIGATPDGVLTTLGRGGSDYSATILGAALGVDEVIGVVVGAQGPIAADIRRRQRSDPTECVVGDARVTTDRFESITSVVAVGHDARARCRGAASVRLGRICSARGTVTVCVVLVGAHCAGRGCWSVIGFDQASGSIVAIGFATRWPGVRTPLFVD